MGLRCWRVRKLLPMLVGDDLSESLKKPIELHVESCPDCREHLAALEQSQNFLSRCREQLGDASHVQSLWPAIRAQLPYVETIPSPAPSWLPVGTLLAASVVIGVVLLHGPSDSAQVRDRHTIRKPLVLSASEDTDGSRTEIVPTVDSLPGRPALFDDVFPWNAYFHLESARPLELTPREF